MPRESKRCNTDGGSVWIAGETMLRNKPHLVNIDNSQPMNLSALLVDALHIAHPVVEFLFQS